MTLSVIRGDGVAADGGAVHLGEMRRDLSGGQPTGSQRQHDLINAIQAARPLAHDGRCETAVPIAGDLNVHRPDLGDHRLGAGAVAGVAAVAAHRVVSVIAQVLGHFRLQRGLEHRLGQPSQQATLANKLHPLSTGLLHQFLRELLLINLSRHGLDRLGHDWSLPPSTARRVGQLHRSSDSPVLHDTACG